MSGGIRYTGDVEYLGEEPLPEDYEGKWMGIDPPNRHRRMVDTRYLWDPWREYDKRGQIYEIDGERLIESLPPKKEPEMHKEVKEVLRGIEHVKGVELRATSKGHIAVYFNEKLVSTISRTPSDSRWRQNVLSDLRRVGIFPNTTKSKNGEKEPMITPMPIEDIRKAIDKMAEHRGARAMFARFLVYDMPVLQPGIKTHASVAAAEQTIGQLMKNHGLSPEMHLLYSEALNVWDSLEAMKRRTEREAEFAAANKPPTRDMSIVHKPAPTPTPEQAPTPEPAVLEPAASTNGSSNKDAYMQVLLEILKKDGSTTDEKILERLDKLAGI